MGITQKTPHTNVWVVYIHFKPEFSVFPAPTAWRQFKTKKEADVYYREIIKLPTVLEVEKPRMFKHYRLPCETYQASG
jgi:hypothetical protein